MILTTINPATENAIADYVELDLSTINHKLTLSQQTYIQWKKTTFDQRRRLFMNLSNLLRQEIESLSEIITTEMGKPITQSKAEIEKCAWLCEHYAAQGETYLQSHIIETQMKKTEVCYQPLGIVFAIMPWKFPFWQVLRCAVPTIMAGNAFLLKHAPISLGAGNAMATLFAQAGFPEDLFQHLIISNEHAALVIAHDYVQALSFTGSEKTGRIVAASAASNLKKCVLELGGNDPYIILADADLELAAREITTSRLNNCGQVCIAAKRVIAVQEIYLPLKERIIALMASWQCADPQLDSTRLGPMARSDLRDNLHQQVKETVDQGAKLLRGGVIPQQKGFYYPATLLDDVRPHMTAFEEELFGPVISLINASNESAAIDLANLSRYGLGAAVFTNDIARGETIATTLIEAGSCFVNSLVASDPRVPFGGIKNSGFGRELSREGILEFVNVKTVAIK